MGRPPACIRRIDRRHRRRHVLVRATSFFPRRYLMRRGIVLGVLIAIGTLSLLAAGFQNPPAGQARGGAAQAPQPLEIQKVKDNLYMITGGGGNTAAFITDGGVVVVNTKANMEKMDAFKGDKAKFLPKKTYKDKMTLGKGKDEIDLFYFGRAHTSGDTWVVFPSLRAMHAGDAFAGKNTPIIDANNGGSAVEYAKTLAKASSSIKNVDTILTGHSTLMTPADLKEYADFNNDFLTGGQGEIKAGKTVDTTAAEFKIPDKYKGYSVSTFLGGVKNNVQIAFNELKK